MRTGGKTEFGGCFCRVRDFLSAGALSSTVSWALTRLAFKHARLPRISPPCTILDPCVGRGGLLIEAVLTGNPDTPKTRNPIRKPFEVARNT